MYYTKDERAWMAALELLTDFRRYYWYGLTYSPSYSLGGELEEILLGKRIEYF